MPRGIDWEELAWERGFKGDEKLMLQTMYETMGHVEMGEILGCHAATIKTRMIQLKIELRPLNSRLPNRERILQGPRFNYKTKRG
jgi:hypothetical protein